MPQLVHLIELGEGQVEYEFYKIYRGARIWLLNELSEHNMYLGGSIQKHIVEAVVGKGVLWDIWLLNLLVQYNHRLASMIHVSSIFWVFHDETSL